MNYITQFNKDFSENKINIRSIYSSNSDTSSVVNDLYDNLPVTSACLPIAKQIVGPDQQINIKLPRLADLFLGIEHQPTINSISFTIHNYTESIEIEGQLKQIGNNQIWMFTELPIPLLSVNYDESIYLEICIKLNNQYNLQTFNQDVFKAYGGYFNKTIQSVIMNQAVYQIPLINSSSKLSIVCGLWTITDQS